MYLSHPIPKQEGSWIWTPHSLFLFSVSNRLKIATCELFKKYDCLMEAEFLYEMHEMGSVPDCHRSAFYHSMAQICDLSFSCPGAQISAVIPPHLGFALSNLVLQIHSTFSLATGQCKGWEKGWDVKRKVMMVLPTSCRSVDSFQSLPWSAPDFWPGIKHCLNFNETHQMEAPAPRRPQSLTCELMGFSWFFIRFKDQQCGFQVIYMEYLLGWMTSAKIKRIRKKKKNRLIN